MKIFDPKLTGSIEIQNTITGNVTIAGGLTVEGSLGGGITGSATASYVEYSNIANKPTLLSGSAQIASDISGSFTSLSSSVASELLKNTTDTLTGDLTVTGTITAQEFHTEFVSASIIYESGSTKFGDSSDDIHRFTGSLQFSTSSNIVDNGISHYTNGYLYIRGGANGAAMITDGSGTTTGFYANDVGTAVITTADVDRMTVSSAGDVTFTKPDDLRLTLTDSGDNSSLILRADATNEIYTNTNNDLQIYTNGNQNGQIFLDQSRGNVGIGNTDPTAKLTVGGNIYTTTLVQAGVGILQGDATYGAVLGSNSSGRGIAISRDSAPGTYPDLIVTGSNGDVGIGTANPSAKLHIWTPNTSGAIGLYLGNTSNPDHGNVLAIARRGTDYTLNDSSLVVYSKQNSFGTYEAAHFRARGYKFQKHDGTEFLAINQDGNINIGNTNPQNKVDIYSNENVPLRIHRPSNANLDSSGAWGIGFSTRGDALTSTDDVRAGIFSYYNGNLFFATNTTDIEPDPDASARMTILNNGKIGIGTDDPSANGLHIEKTGNHLFLRASTATAGKYWNFDVTSANQLYIINNGGTGMTILDNGNVGIGTTSPQALLHLRADAPFVYFDDTSTSGTRTRFQLVVGDVGNTQSGIFGFNNTSGTSLLEVLTLSENGVVGIGTNNPDQKPKLHVYNNSDDGDYGTKIQAIFGNRGYLDSDANNIYGSGTSETQFLNGSSSRPAMISLGGDLATNETVGVINFFRNSNSQGYRSRALIDCGVLNNGTADRHGGRLRFWTADDGSTNPGVRLIILEDGKVGIGTQSPSAPLQVNGQQKWYTTNADGNELRGLFNPGGAADDALISLYKADGSTSGLELGATYINLGLRTYNSVNGVTLYGSAGTIQSDITANSTGYEVFLVNNITSGGTASVVQYRTNGVVEGSILGNASGLSFSNNSDYRKKTEIRDLSGSLAVVDSLQPRLYKYREGFGKPTDKDFVGFIAHEIQEILPDSVNNNKDDVYTQEDIDNGVTGFNVGDPKYQTVAYSSNEIITYLVGAVKELKAEIDALKNA